MEQVKIRLQNISKSYYSETAVTQALRKINLEFSMGEFVAITGESGSGKSTLLNIIGGMDTFDEGEMFVDGEPTFQYDDQDWEAFRRNKIGYIFQDYSLVGHYTALDNVMSALLILGVEKKDARETAMKYLAQVGLAGYETHRASELSSGQKQRLSIARALAKNTEIIVADEPTGNLEIITVGNAVIEVAVVQCVAGGSCNGSGSTVDTGSGFWDVIDGTVLVKMYFCNRSRTTESGTTHQHTIVIDEVCLALEIKDCHMVCIRSSGRLHDNLSRLESSCQKIVCCCISHLLSPAISVEEIILAVRFSVGIFATVDPRCLRVRSRRFLTDDITIQW